MLIYRLKNISYVNIRGSSLSFPTIALREKKNKVVVRKTATPDIDV
jgi:hypothetical protein